MLVLHRAPSVAHPARVDLQPLKVLVLALVLPGEVAAHPDVGPTARAARLARALARLSDRR